MRQILHGSATTTEAARRAIQNSQASLREFAGRYGINPKTVAKWRRRSSVCDARRGPREPRSTVLSNQEEVLVVAFRKHTLLPLDNCLYALQATVPHLTRSSLHRCFQRHGISRLPETVQRHHYGTRAQLKAHVHAFLMAYNFAKRLKTLRGLTPYEHIWKVWTTQPNRFRLNSLHHTVGLNTWNANCVLFFGGA
jgi:hypothetical protein